jgi:hypothetical protein
MGNFRFPWVGRFGFPLTLIQEGVHDLYWHWPFACGSGGDANGGRCLGSR